MNEVGSFFRHMGQKVQMVWEKIMCDFRTGGGRCGEARGHTLGGLGPRKGKTWQAHISSALSAIARRRWGTLDNGILGAMSQRPQRAFGSVWVLRSWSMGFSRPEKAGQWTPGPRHWGGLRMKMLL